MHTPRKTEYKLPIKTYLGFYLLWQSLAVQPIVNTPEGMQNPGGVHSLAGLGKSEVCTAT